MTIPRIDSIGFCAHYSPQGDWAFDYALRLSENRGLQLNVFHFLCDPYDPRDDPDECISKRDLSQIAFEKERELRMYYDRLAGDYLEVGFRLCFDNSWRELHRCLTAHEFQLLVLAKPVEPTIFCGKQIEEFANNFVSPVVLVGPRGPGQIQLNSRAALLQDRLGLETATWRKIESA